MYSFFPLIFSPYSFEIHFSENTIFHAQGLSKQFGFQWVLGGMQGAVRGLEVAVGDLGVAGSPSVPPWRGTKGRPVRPWEQTSVSSAGGTLRQQNSCPLIFLPVGMARKKSPALSSPQNSGKCKCELLGGLVRPGSHRRPSNRA